MGCREKPTTEQYPPARPAPRAAAPPLETKMNRQDWEAKEARTNKNILLQVAFKAAVELYGKLGDKVEATGDVWIIQKTVTFHNWLLSQTEGQKTGVAQNPSSNTLNNFRPEPDAPYEEEVPIEAFDEGVWKPTSTLVP